MNITAYDELGNTFNKTVTMYGDKENIVVSLGFPMEWRMKDVIEPPREGDDKMYIDASGRNHKGSSVYIFHSGLLTIVNKMINKELEGKLTE